MRQFGLIESDLGWLNIVVVQRRWSEREEKNVLADKRAVCEIMELVPASKNDDENEKENDDTKMVTRAWKMRPIFQWNASERKLVFVQASELVRERFAWTFPMHDFEKEWKILAREYNYLTHKKGRIHE